MDSLSLESKSTHDGSQPQTSVSASSANQLLISDTIELPDDTFRMSLDNYSFVGENVTIGERNTSTTTPTLCLPTPNTVTPNTPLTPVTEKSPPIEETPKLETSDLESRKPPNLSKISMANKNEMDEKFIRPSPVADFIMSPAKMLQYEMGNLTCSTPTMKRAAIDFNFFNKNNFEEYFNDVPATEEECNKNKPEDKDCEETTVIVKPDDTVRHEIEYDC